MAKDYSGKISAAMEKNGFPYKGPNRPSACPFCGHQTLYVDDRKGVFSCFHNSCSKQGGALDFALYFYTDVVPVNPAPQTKAEAIRTLELDCGMESIMAQAVRNKTASVAVDNPPCPIEKREAVYRRMLRYLPLKEKDLASLKARGYTEEQVVSYGYRSLPSDRKERQEVAAKLMRDELSLAGIPGFEKTESGYELSDFGLSYRKKIFGYEGLPDSDFYCFLVPSYDIHARLQYFQIAWDKRLCGKDVDTPKGKRNFAKYTMFSTPSKLGGGSARSVPGYLGMYKLADDDRLVPALEGVKYIPVIEGTLKSHLYYVLNKEMEPCISQVGVSNYKAMKNFLVDFVENCPDIEGIVDAYDMDKLTNDNVRAGSERLKEICEELGLKYKFRRWDPAYKGIDDYVYAIRKGIIKK